MSVTTSLATSEATEFVLHDRKFGLEIEYGGPNPDTLGAVLEAHGLRVTHRWENGGWESGWDSWGELRSPPLAGVEGVRDVRRACDALEEHGATPSDYGLHVHHDAYGLTPSSVVRLLKNYSASQLAIRELLARSRHDNGYCMELDPLGIASLGENPTMHEVARYADRTAMSTYRIESYGTLEFRAHEATVDSEEILAWVAFGQAMIYAAANGVAIEATKAEDLIAILAERGKLCSRAARILREKAARLRSRQYSYDY